MPPLATALFDYELPPQLVAQVPVSRRDASHLLVVHRATRRLEHRRFSDLPDYVESGDILLRNNAAVLPARLHALRATGGSVECFLLRPLARTSPTLLSGEATACSEIHPVTACIGVSGLEDASTWRCLVRPGRKLPPGARFADPTGAFTAEVIAREEDGTAIVRFATASGESITAVANRLGDVPLPPYIERPAAPAPVHDQQRALDRERYQTVYAERTRQVAVAAPTAGLHFTPELLAQLAAMNVLSADLTLHVGLGTFKPIATITVEAHAIHRERYEISAETQRRLFFPWSGRRIAVGTTSVRTVEDFLAAHPAPLPDGHACLAEAEIFIHPPRTFRGIDALITNFHQPRSTLLCLVAAFLTPGKTDGIAWIREIYGEAIARKYRFFSYGDAMLIL